MQSAAPPLPPRSQSPSPSSTSQTSHTSLQRPRADTVHLTPYTRSTSQSTRQSLPGQDGPPPRYQEHWSSDDPRSSSQQSLLPVESAGEGRRKLLLIYIHGFMGNETSFKSFPAHVHNILTVTLAESHVVHTKIYARYKSRRAIDFARDDFSNWYFHYQLIRSLTNMAQATAPRVSEHRCHPSWSQSWRDTSCRGRSSAITHPGKIRSETTPYPWGHGI
jgi:hypothetical protein